MKRCCSGVSARVGGLAWHPSNPKRLTAINTNILTLIASSSLPWIAISTTDAALAARQHLAVDLLDQNVPVILVSAMRRASRAISRRRPRPSQPVFRGMGSSCRMPLHRDATRSRADEARGAHVVCAGRCGICSDSGVSDMVLAVFREFLTFFAKPNGSKIKAYQWGRASNWVPLSKVGVRAALNLHPHTFFYPRGVQAI